MCCFAKIINKKACLEPYFFHLLYKYLRPQIFKQSRKLREIITKEGYSYKPFDDTKSIFIHIPRCAGVSIANSLFGNLGGGHSTIKKYMIAFSPREFNSYFKFTVVRNPWDRLVSAFFFLKNGGFNEKDKVWAEKNLSSYNSFDSFVLNWVNKDNIRHYNHFVPQCDYLFASDNYNLKRLNLDFVGRFENIKEDFEFIRESIHVKSALLFKNKSDRKDYKEYYTEATKRIVATVYADDIRVFGYTFDNLNLNKHLIESHRARPSL